MKVYPGTEFGILQDVQKYENYTRKVGKLKCNKNMNALRRLERVAYNIKKDKLLTGLQMEDWILLKI